MARKTKREQTGLLDEPGVVLPQARALSSFFFSTVLLSVALLGSLGCFFTAFRISLKTAPVFLLGAAGVLLCSLQTLVKRRKWTLDLSFALLWALLAWREFPVLAEGAVRIGNTVLGAYSERLTFQLPTLQLPAGTALSQQDSVTVLTVFLELLLAWLFSLVLLRRRSALGAFCLSGLFLLLPLGFSILPAVWALGVLFTFWGFLLLAAPSLRRYPLEGEKGRLHVSGENFLGASALLLLPAMALCLLFVYHTWPPETYQRPKLADQILHNATQGMNLPAVFRNGTGSGGDRLDFTTLANRQFTGETALRVRYDWENGASSSQSSPSFQKDYLKNFVGSVYTGFAWERLPSKEAAKVKEALNGHAAQTLPADLAQTLPCEYDTKAAYSLSVEKGNADQAAVYMPYGLAPPSRAPKNMTFVDDGFLRSSRLFSTPREYEVSALPLPMMWNTLSEPGATAGPVFRGIWLCERFPSLQSHWADALSGYGWSVSSSSGSSSFVFSSSGSSSSTSSSGSAISSSGSFSSTILLPGTNAVTEIPLDSPALLMFSEDPCAVDLWHLPKEVFEEEGTGEEGIALARSMEAYTDLVYEYYTQLPDNIREMAERYLEENSLIPPSPADRTDFIERIRAALKTNCTYTLTPPAVPEGRDLTDFFLNESRTGYCVHFATAAAVLLRAAGVPARYAEGYAVPVKNEGEWIDVPDYNAHAWVEVYWGGLGWVPYEVTPAGPDSPAAYETAAAPEKTEQKPGLSPTPSPTPEPAASRPEEDEKLTADTQPTPEAGPGAPGGPSQGRGLHPFVAFLLCTGGILLIYPLLEAQRRVRISWRKRQFSQEDRNRAALRVYVHLLRLYRENSVLPYHGTAPPEEIEELALRARFSQHTLTQEELARMTDQAALMEKRLAEKLPRAARLKCKYLLALF